MDKKILFGDFFTERISNHAQIVGKANGCLFFHIHLRRRINFIFHKCVISLYSFLIWKRNDKKEWNFRLHPKNPLIIIMLLKQFIDYASTQLRPEAIGRQMVLVRKRSANATVATDKLPQDVVFLN